MYLVCLKHSGGAERPEAREGTPLWVAFQVAAHIVDVTAHEMTEPVRLQECCRDRKYKQNGATYAVQCGITE